MKNFTATLDKIIADVLNTEPRLQITPRGTSLVVYLNNSYICTLRKFPTVSNFNSYIETTRHSPIPENIRGTIGYVPALELPKEFRGRGVGTNLVKKLLDKAAVDNIIVHAGDPWGTATMQQENFWYGLGFKKLPYDDGTYHHVPMILSKN